MSSFEGQNNQATEIELLPFSEQIEAASRWRYLERSIRNTGLTNSWSWVKTWLDNYDGIVQPIFAFGKQGNQLIAAALITKTTHRIRGIPIASVHLGTAGEPERESTFVQYNRLLVGPAQLEAFAAGLISTLRQHFRWSELRFDGFVPGDADALIRAGAKSGLHFKIDQRKSPAFDFQKAAEEGYQDVISAFGNNTRYNIRRSLRLFERNFGQRRLVWAETPDEARENLYELINLHQKRWERVGEPGAFQSNRVKRYHEDLIDTLSLWPQGSLIVFRIVYGETTIGCLFNFVDEGGHVLSYKSGFPLFDDNRLKPGLVTHVVCMEECKRRGLVEEEKLREGGYPEEEFRKRGLLRYDFLTGETQYKQQLSNMEDVLTWTAARRGPRMWLIDKARPPLRLTREIIKSVKAGELYRKAAV